MLRQLKMNQGQLNENNSKDIKKTTYQQPNSITEGNKLLKKKGNIHDKYLSQSKESDGFAKSLKILKKIIKCKKKQQQPQKNEQIIQMKIELPLKNKYLYQLTGHILTEIHPDNDTYIQMHVKAVEKSEQLYTIHSNNVHSLTEFRLVIHYLEHSQSQIYYQTAQLLKQYQDIVQKQIEYLNFIKQQISTDYLLDLQHKRNQFKDTYILEYTQQHFTEEDFYIICNISPNIDRDSSNINNVRFSKPYFSIIGIDDSLFENIYFRKYLLFLILPPRSRQQFFNQFLQTYLVDDKTSPMFIKNFEFITIDEISIVCDAQIQCINIPYPEHLKNSYLDSLHLMMDNINIATLDIKDYHIKRVLEKRSNSQMIQFKDFEYSIFAEMFLEKYYSEEFTHLHHQQIQKEQIEEEQEKNELKRCQFKEILPSQK